MPEFLWGLAVGTVLGGVGVVVIKAAWTKNVTPILEKLKTR